MAWDALGNIFQRKEKQEKTDRGQMLGGQSSGARTTPQASNAPFLNGTGGSSAGPVSSRFVNFGTLYDLNKDKAGQMAANVHGKAQAAVDAAKGKLEAAKNTFDQKREAGAGGWRPIQGQHGTEIRPQTPNATQPATQPAPDRVEGKSGGRWGNPDQTQGINPSGGVSYGGPIVNAGKGVTSAGTSRYTSLYGPASSLGEWSPDAAQNARDYNHSVSELEAKSGAGQGYTGPDSLKDSMGEEEYGKLMAELAAAERGAENLTNAGGIATALGYEPDSSVGMSSLDAGLAQVAGQSNFKALADKTKGLKDTLPQAQWDSIGQAGTAGANSASAAKEWQDLLDEYEANQGDTAGAITIDAAQGDATGDRIGLADTGLKNSDGGMLDPTGGENTRVSEITSKGYSIQDINDIWDELTPEERAWLKQGYAMNEVNSLQNQQAWANVIQSILAKLAASKGK